MSSVPYLDLVLDHIQACNRLQPPVISERKVVCGATGAAVGGFLLGPIGVALGGLIGSVFEYDRADHHPNVSELVRQLNEDQKKALVQSIMRAAGGLTIEHFYTWYSADQSNRNVVLSLVSAAAALAQSPT